MDFKNIFLFENFNTKEIEEIKKFSILKKLKTNENIFYEGEKPDFLHILIQGSAKIYKVDSKNKEIMIHKFTPISLIAERANLSEIPFPASCAMDSDGMIMKIDYHKFKQIMSNHPEISFKIIKSLLNKMHTLDNIIKTNLVLNTETKIAKFIYEKPEIFENIKQHCIANLLNIKPETLSRKLKTFKELGIIENVNSKLKIKDRDKIKQIFEW